MRLLGYWRDCRRQIVHVRHDSREASSPLTRGQPGNGFKPGFEPSDGEWLVAKSCHSAFIGTDLALRLRSAGLQSVTVFGLTTDQCVSTTARMASDFGFETTVAEDACACFEQTSFDGVTVPAESIHLAHTTTLNTDFARVVRVDDLIAEQVAGGTAASLQSQPGHRSGRSRTSPPRASGGAKKFGLL